MENIISILFQAYLLGCLFVGAQSIYTYVKILALQKAVKKNVFAQHPKMKQWLIQRVVYWPYYLFIKTNPIDLFSQLFFSRYGDKGHIYYGITGLKNFLNDIFKGKNRYKRFNVFTTTISLSSSFINKMMHEYPGENYPKYAIVLLARHQDNYLFKSTFVTYDRLPEQRTSRFELDSCQRLIKEEVFAALDEMNSNISQKILEKMK